MLPKTIDELDWTDLSRNTSRVKRYTPQQREIVFKKISKELDRNPKDFARELRELQLSLFCNRDFHKRANLDCLDKKEEKGQIIRVTLAEIYTQAPHNN